MAVLPTRRQQENVAATFGNDRPEVVFDARRACQLAMYSGGRDVEPVNHEL